MITLPEFDYGRNTIFCDLDGTLLKINSYKHWVVLCCIISVITLNILFLVRVSLFFLKKRRGSMTRWDVKRHIMLKVHDSVILRKFTRSLFPLYLSCFIRKKLLNEILSYNLKTVIVTAAFYDYCFFLKKYGFEIVGTKLGEDENIGTTKLKNSTSYLSGKVVFYTDHYDDIPLAEIVDQVFLVSPSRKTIMLFKKSRSSFSLWPTA